MDTRLNRMSLIWSTEGENLMPISEVLEVSAAAVRALGHKP